MACKSVEITVLSIYVYYRDHNGNDILIWIIERNGKSDERKYVNHVNICFRPNKHYLNVEKKSSSG